MIIFNGYQIKPHAKHPKCYIVVTDGKGGKIPNILEGMFTNTDYAKAAVLAYLESKSKKDTGDGKKSNETIFKG